MTANIKDKDLFDRAKGLMKSHASGQDGKEGSPNPSERVNKGKPMSGRPGQEISVDKLRKAKEFAKAQKKARKHVVQSDETLSHISLKYYGSAAKDKWMIIYEANKEIIGDNPNIIRPGMELIIPDFKR